MQNLFVEIGIIIIAAALLAYIAHRQKQPLILAYLVAGVAIGPVGMGLLADVEKINTLSEIGIAFLLFIVGLELDLRKMKSIGKPVIAAGLGQVILTFTVGYLLSRYLGVPQVPSFYVSLGLTLSSTVLVVKLLSDRNEINTLHANLAVGILLVQDMIAMLALAVLPNLSSISLFPILRPLASGIILLGVAVIAGKFLLEPVFKRFALAQEMLFLASIAWLFFLGLLAYVLDFSVSVGAFIAGVSLAPLPYRTAIIASTRSLRNFFATIFFVTIGMQVTLSGILAYWPLITVFTVFVVVGNPIIVYAILAMFGFTARTSLLTGLSLAQVSEFSLILALEGARHGQISQDVIALIALVLLLSFAASTYLIIGGSQIYRIMSPFIKPLEKYAPVSRRLKFLPSKKYLPEAVLIGCNRMGLTVLKALRELKLSVLVIDSNPDAIKHLMEERIPCIYGDVSDTEIVEESGLKKAKLVVSTTPDIEVSRLLVSVKRKKPVLILTASHSEEALEFYESGADYVVLPHHLGGQHLAMLLHQSNKNLGKLVKQKVAHLEELRLRLKRKLH
ncbi:MAG: cation:proton antiporter [Candidatus Aenigmarchaeota archaeon]|nr:cation:proton antiporter [Candidatus Aenigmarchaeota archaeon]